MTTQFRNLLRGPEALLVPMAYDAVTARVIEEAGFSAMGTSGSNIAASMLGVPDIALTTLTEMVTQNRNIVNAVKIPVFADADNGYGTALNVMRTVKEYEGCGLACLFFEDQVHPKRCGHYENTRVIPAEQMEQKIRAALEARRDPDFLIIARTDARSSLGLEEAINRGNRYAAAGADVIFIEAPKSKEELAEIPKRVSAPLLVNVVEGGKTPMLSAAELAAMGYRIIMYPDSIMTAAVFAMRQAMLALKRDGTTAAVRNNMVGFYPLQELVRFSEFAELQRRYGDPG
jgi:carboxyvinyl-carboxyphosphonate phosphorylmutase